MACQVLAIWSIFKLGDFTNFPFLNELTDDGVLEENQTDFFLAHIIENICEKNTWFMYCRGKHCSDLIVTFSRNTSRQSPSCMRPDKVFALLNIILHGCNQMNAGRGQVQIYLKKTAPNESVIQKKLISYAQSSLLFTTAWISLPLFETDCQIKSFCSLFCSQITSKFCLDRSLK